jgi:membrane protein implicated in regulation of membrane protease activity
MAWWIWMLLGLVLLVAELLTPGSFFIIFFGFGAFSVGVLTAFDAAGPLWLQWLLFSVLSVLSLALCRKRLVLRFKSHPRPGEVDTLVGEIAVTMQEIAAGAVGKAELRGTVWTTRNLEQNSLAAGRRCRVERVEGLTLFVRGE